MNKRMVTFQACLFVIGTFCMVANAECPPCAPGTWPNCVQKECDSANCKTCVDGSCVVCGGDPNKFCCGGACGDSDANESCCDNKTIYNFDTKQCCGYGNGKTCEKDECCIDGECVEPICDNCHSVSDTLFECGHYAGDPCGTSCATDWCIIDVLDSASCDYKGDDWPCNRSKCNTTTVSPHDDEIVQSEVRPSTCLGGTVNWVIWTKLYYGCTSCGPQPWYKSCDSFGCPGPIIGRYGRGDKKQCGGCN